MKNTVDRYDNVDLTENAANIVREENKKKKIRFANLDDDNIPVVKKTNDDGFWGNNTTGHMDDKDNR
jgi:hypothetical protein